MILLQINPMVNVIVMFTLMFVLMYFIMIRPAQKKAKEQQDMMNNLAPGERVMLSSGLFGTIKHMGERQAVIELAPGLEVTVVKPAISRVVKPEDEDFEYEDPAEPVIETDEEFGVN